MRQLLSRRLAFLTESRRASLLGTKRGFDASSREARFQEMRPRYDRGGTIEGLCLLVFLFFLAGALSQSVPKTGPQ